VLDLPPDEVHVWLLQADSAHDALRLLLARYLDEEPDAIRFATHPQGKPYLDGDTSVRFNLSHSGDLAAAAVALRREVGVDVERRRPVRSADRVARRIMSDAELARYLALPDDERNDFLLWVWTRKEALVKASGTGIRASLQAVASEPVAGGRFSVTDLVLPEHAGAVAAEGDGWHLVVRDGRAG